MTMVSMTPVSIRRAAVGAFWDLIDEHLQRMDFPPSKRRLALHLGVAPQTLTNWQTGLTKLPDRENLEAVATFLGKPYGDVLAAALHDFHYLPESDLDQLDPPARMNRRGKSSGRAMRQAQDDVGESPDPAGPEEGA